MSDQKKQKTILRTPAGRAIFPRLTEPDTKFNAAGEYTIKVAFQRGEPGVDEFLARLDELHAQAQADALAEARSKNPKASKVKEGSLPYADSEETEGEVTVSFKMTAGGISKKTGKPWSRKPALYDAKGVVLEGVNVGGGSIVKVAFEPSLYFKPATGAGVSRRLEAVQVLKLVEWNGQARSASAFGFEQEDGFEAQAPEVVDAFESGSSNDESDF